MKCRLSLSECDSSSRSSKVMTPMDGMCLDEGFLGYPLSGEALKHIAFLHVVEIGQRDAALEPSFYFAGIVLEALQAFDLAGVNQHIVPQHADFAVADQYA